MKKRKLLTAFVMVFLLLSLLTLTVFALWDTLSKSDDIELIAGDGTELVLSNGIALDPDKTLIPITAAQGENDVYELRFKFELTLSKKVKTPLSIEVEINNVNPDLFTTAYTLSAPTINKDEVVDLVITVAFTNPLDPDLDFTTVYGKLYRIGIDVTAVIN